MTHVQRLRRRLCLALPAACGTAWAATPAPLTVTGSVPGDGGDHTPRNRQPSFTFSALLDPATVHAGTFALRAGPAVLPSAIRVVDRVAQLLPQARLLPQTAYTVRAEPGLRDRAGQTLAAPVQRGFVTADALWRPTLHVAGADNPPVFVGDRQIAVTLDAQGQSFAAWHELPGAQWARVQVARSSPGGGGWGSPTTIFEDAGQVRDLKMVADAAGNVLLVWEQLNSIAGVEPYSVIWGVRFDKAFGLWETPRVLSHSDGSSARQAQVAVRPNGEAAVAWVRLEADRQTSSVWIAITTLPVTRWTVPHRIDNPTDASGSAGLLSIAMGQAPGGRTVVTWSAPTSSGGVSGIWARVIDDRPPGLTPARLISNNAGLTEDRPRVVIDAAGDAYVCWWQYGDPAVSGEQSIWLARYDAGGWRDRRLLFRNVQRMTAPFIATGTRVDGTPSTWVSWIDIPNGNIWVSPVGRDSAGPPRQLAGGMPIQRHTGHALVRLAVDRAGNVLALWPTAYSGNAGNLAPERVWTARYVERLGQWSAPTILDDAGVRADRSFALAINAVGDVAVIWQASAAPAGGGPALDRVRSRRFE